MSLFHLIAPSGYCIKQHAALRGIQRLTDEGHQVNNVEVIAVVVSVCGYGNGASGRSQFPCQTDYPQHHRAGCTRRLRCQSFTGRY
ncbi:muramoyltetrapeptide carboxypeptidase [Escherichia coli]|uniref:Muramoyltetrapeptide carboxypeptidase n=1 Tax=Escherichia coli TaxID=562 RepID=A0A377E5B6_ECOLX|nr:muramoyltetrapeptide carboxypeptidase [Escherichia coli]